MNTFWNVLPYQLKKEILPQICTLRLINKQTSREAIRDWIVYFILKYKITEEDATEYLTYSSSIYVLYTIELFKKKTLKLRSHGIFYRGRIELQQNESGSITKDQEHQGYGIIPDYDQEYDEIDVWMTFDHYTFNRIKNLTIQNIILAIYDLDKSSYDLYNKIFDINSYHGTSIYGEPWTRINIFYDIKSTYNILRSIITEYASDTTDNLIHDTLKQRLLNEIHDFGYTPEERESLCKWIDNL